MKKNRMFYIILGLLISLTVGFLAVDKLQWIPALTLVGLAFIQNTSFSMVSRSRNRDNMDYHAIASFFSNTIWFITMRELVKAELDIWLFAPYALGTISGSLFGVKVSMAIETFLGARSDSHIREK